MMTLRTRRTSRLIWLRCTLASMVGAALCVCGAATQADAATAHPVAHAVAHHSAGKDHAVPVKATSKPVAKAVATHGAAKARRVEADDDAPATKGHAKAATNSKGSRAATSKAKAHAKVADKPEPPARKGVAKSKRHKQPPADDADNDPPVIYRTSARASARSGSSSGVKPAATKVEPRNVAVHAPAPHVVREEESSPAEIGSAFPDGDVKGHHERRPGPAAAAAKHGFVSSPAVDTSGTASNHADDASRTQATNEDFLRAAGIARVDASAKAEVFERGESHPDNDVRVDMRTPATPGRAAVVPTASQTLSAKGLIVAAAATPAMVMAAPAPAVTTGSLHVKKTTKVNILPDDLAGKDALIEEAMTPMVLPNLYSGGRLVVPPPMKGTHEILVHQNTMADADGLSRIQDDDDLNRMRAAHLLVPLEDSDALEVNSGLPENRRYARPWTVRFVQDTARAYYTQFHQSLTLTSAVRTVAYQLRLQRVNGNAAAVDGEDASPHLTGQAIDFGKRGMTVKEIAWMRAYLGPIMDAGKIDVEEEFQQACFHISVYKAYVPAPVKRPRVMQVAQVHQAPIVRRAPRVDGPSDDSADASPDSQQ